MSRNIILFSQFYFFELRFPNFFFHSTLGSLICQPQMLRNHNFF
nr:MAG TPA: protein of unknown function (DUF1993) [Caudoviricetes sp.]DAI85381.1 MAG TPA: protein of unknown function (DUF1993) [Caudoviricetes sp.]